MFGLAGPWLDMSVSDGEETGRSDCTMPILRCICQAIINLGIHVKTVCVCVCVCVVLGGDAITKSDLLFQPSELATDLTLEFEFHFSDASILVPYLMLIDCWMRFW